MFSIAVSLSQQRYSNYPSIFVQQRVASVSHQQFLPKISQTVSCNPEGVKIDNCIDTKILQMKMVSVFSYMLHFSILCLNPIALRTAKTQWSFGHSECNMVKETYMTVIQMTIFSRQKTDSSIAVSLIGI